MTNNDRNTRTLIISFVIAIMALVPLRFYEVGQQSVDMMTSLNVQVLGEVEEIAEPTMVPAQPLLESPWNDVDVPLEQLLDSDGV